MISLPKLRTQDPKVFGTVAVLFGGSSAEREVSLASGKNVLLALQTRGVDAIAVDGISGLLEGLSARRFTRVFHVLHGHRGGGEDGVVQGVLDAFEIPYTGSGVLGSALSMDKIRTKQIWLANGIPTPRYFTITSKKINSGYIREQSNALGFPLIIKPANEGSSVGITRVAHVEELENAIHHARSFDSTVLVEELIEGDELTVGIVGNTVLPSVQILPLGKWYDYDAKYLSDKTRYVCPGLPVEQETVLADMALRAFDSIGCQGWGRLDIMCNRLTGQPYFLEVNTAPGMTSHSLLPKAAAQCGITFEELVWRILELTL